eukprot:47134-Chlamydomonas_euryale.AAC.2
MQQLATAAHHLQGAPHTLGWAAAPPTELPHRPLGRAAPRRCPHRNCCHRCRAHCFVPATAGAAAAADSAQASGAAERVAAAGIHAAAASRNAAAPAGREAAAAVGNGLAAAWAPLRQTTPLPPPRLQPHTMAQLQAARPSRLRPLRLACKAGKQGKPAIKQSRQAGEAGKAGYQTKQAIRQSSQAGKAGKAGNQAKQVSRQSRQADKSKGQAKEGNEQLDQQTNEQADQPDSQTVSQHLLCAGAHAWVHGQSVHRKKSQW